MDKAKLLTFIAALYLLEIKERAEQIKNTAKENGIKEGDFFNMLKEAGYNPKAEKGSPAPDGASNTPPSGDGSDNKTPPKAKVTLRHKTEYPQYRRAGLILKQTPAEFFVTEKQLAVLKKDNWIEVKEK